MIAKSRAPELRTADVEDIQALPGEPDGAMILGKIKTAGRPEVIIRGKVSANGGLALSQPEVMESLGSIFDNEADKRLALVIERIVGRR